MCRKKTLFGLKHYWKPTPKTARVLGDSLLYGGTLAGGMLANNNDMKLAAASMVLGVVGKFFSNWATETEAEQARP